MAKMHDFASTQFNLPESVAQTIIDWGKKWIPDDALAAGGRETDIHVTVKYGLTRDDLATQQELTRLLRDAGPVHVLLDRVFRFDTNSDFDVLYVAVNSSRSQGLDHLNAAITRCLPCKTTHPTYTPHVTIAYVKKGACKDLDASEFVYGKSMDFDTLMLSRRNGKMVPLTEKPTLAKAVAAPHAPSHTPSAHPFLGVVLPGGHVSDYHAPAAAAGPPSHSLHYQDAGLTGFDNDKTLRFVKNMTRGHYELEGHPALHPDTRESHQQIKALAMHLKTHGVPTTTPLVCADHKLPRSQYPHQGHALGTVGDYAGLGLSKAVKIALLFKGISLLKSIKSGVKAGEMHPTMPHLLPSTQHERDTVKLRGHDPVPPASWGLHVSSDPEAKVQATWHDAAGRKQFRYHSSHTQVASDHKYKALAAFHAALPHIRAKVQEDLHKPDASPDRVKAAVVHLMDHTAIRVGSEKYAQDNGTFGASSLRKQHVHVAQDGGQSHTVKVSFTGKHGKEAEKEVHDAPFHAAVSHLMHQPGERVFQQRTKSGGLSPVTEKHVNDYLVGIHPGLHAHQFRTYHGTRIAATHLLSQPHTDDPKIRAKHVTQAMKIVSAHLGNTPEQARKSYVSPEVVHHYMTGTLRPEHAMETRG